MSNKQIDIENNAVFNLPTVKKLGYRAGIFRLAKGVYPELREVAKEYAIALLHQAYLFQHSANRKTLSDKDIIEAGKGVGTRIF